MRIQEVASAIEEHYDFALSHQDIPGRSIQKIPLGNNAVLERQVVALVPYFGDGGTGDHHFITLDGNRVLSRSRRSEWYEYKEREIDVTVTMIGEPFDQHMGYRQHPNGTTQISIGYVGIGEEFSGVGGLYSLTGQYVGAYRELGRLMVHEDPQSGKFIEDTTHPDGKVHLLNTDADSGIEELVLPRDIDPLLWEAVIRDPNNQFIMDPNLGLLDSFQRLGVEINLRQNLPNSQGQSIAS